ncbi:MAG: hypothetical protein ACYDER_28035 [Ktedonobacteraceae bacterium]
MLVPTVFGVALIFSVTTIARGRRTIGYMLALFLWFASVATALPSLLDISAEGLVKNAQGSHIAEVFLLASQANSNPSPAVAKRVMDLLHADIPPTFLSWSFFENRVFFFCLAVLLVWLTVSIVSRRRQAGDRLILLSTHIITDIEAMASQVVLLKSGQICWAGTPNSLLADTAHAVWSLRVSHPEFEALRTSFQISSIIMQEEYMDVHVLSAACPHPQAVAVAPSLEEAYLFFFGDKTKNLHAIPTA